MKKNWIEELFLDLVIFGALMSVVVGVVLIVLWVLGSLMLR